jgi:tetratricopeptide (TPR) repeat protein
MGPDKEPRKAMEYFRHAIDADPNFGPAYIGLAKSYYDLGWPSSDDLNVMRRAAEKAVALDPTSPDARVMLGDVRQIDWDWSGAEDQYWQAIALSPSSAAAHGALGDLLLGLGRLEEGWNEAQIAQQLDPNQDHLSGALCLRGQYDRAIELLKRKAEAKPDDAVVHFDLSQAYALKGMHAQSVQELAKTMTLVGFPEIATRLHHAAATSGWRGALLQWAKELEQLIMTKQAYLPGVLAQTYAQLGDKDRAFYWLEQGLAQDRVTDLGFGVVKVDPMFAPLRSDPRFNEVLRRMGLLP